MSELPPALRAALERRLEGVSRRDLAQRAQAVSMHYRAGGGSAPVVKAAPDALAYALTRLPATYAAGLAVMQEAARMTPGFAPRSLLDAGAGPGGAAWAAMSVWPDVAEATLLDSNPAFLTLAAELAADGPSPLARARRIRQDLAAGAPPAADLVVVSYALAELPPAALPRALAQLWSAAQGLLVLIEPGTPAGFARLRAARGQLIAAEAKIAAPCPHEADCPMAGADWCHFARRLPRSRDHRFAKGADAPFEDEKYAYLVAARADVALEARGPRVLAPPSVGKAGIVLKLCTERGVEDRFVGKRDKAAHATVRRLGWGDALPPTGLGVADPGSAVEVAGRQNERTPPCPRAAKST